MEGAGLKLRCSGKDTAGRECKWSVTATGESLPDEVEDEDEDEDGDEDEYEDEDEDDGDGDEALAVEGARGLASSASAKSLPRSLVTT
jgi:hypothetical protein